MIFVKLEDIVIPETRVRKEFNPEALKDLQESIENEGLFTPLLLQPDERTLIAGERRLRAIKAIYAKNTLIDFDGNTIEFERVPCVILGLDDAEAILEAELNENIKRQQLTWQEQVEATEALYQLKKRKGEVKNVSEFTTEVLNMPKGSLTGIQDDIFLGGYVNDPEVSKAKSKKEALKILERRFDKKYRESLGKQFSEIRHNQLILYKGEMEQLFASTGEKDFDCIIGDPPYGISADKFANQKAVQHHYIDTLEYSNRLYLAIAKYGFKVTKPQAHLYVFCDPRRFEDLKVLFTQEYWIVWDWPLIWARDSNVGIAPRAEYGPRRTYECILFANKGNRRTLTLRPDVIRASHDQSIESGAHKPPALYKDLLERSCNPGDRVLDPCCGSGPIFAAAQQHKCAAVGFEIDAATAELARQRIEGLIA